MVENGFQAITFSNFMNIFVQTGSIFILMGSFFQGLLHFWVILSENVIEALKYPKRILLFSHALLKCHNFDGI